VCGARPRYVRTAKREVDGVLFDVPIQNPRKYALSAFEDGRFAGELFRRLLGPGECGPHLAAFAARDGAGPPLGLNHRLRVLRYRAPEGRTQAAEERTASASSASAPSASVSSASVPSGAAPKEPPDQFEPHYDQVGASGFSVG